MNALLTANNQILSGMLMLSDKALFGGQSKARGKIILQAESVENSNHQIKMTFQANISKPLSTRSKGFLCFCQPYEDNPYLVISRAAAASDETTDDWEKIAESEVKYGQIKNVDFKSITINLNRLTLGKESTKIRFSIYSYIDEFTSILYGHYDTSIKEIRPDPYKERDLINDKARKEEIEQGQIKLTEFGVVEAASFVEYLKHGWIINSICAIDFTASNKGQHVFDKDNFNDYEIAISEVGKILAPYCFKETFMGYGFGGKPTYHPDYKGDALHAFTLTGKKKSVLVKDEKGNTVKDARGKRKMMEVDDPKIVGIEGLLDEYRKATTKTELWGPTFFQEVLHKVQHMMDSPQYLGSSIYHVLLFLTDGNIHDLRETIDAMVYASNYPISIIIVGIGDGDFSSMEYLDGDDMLMRDGDNIEAKRDICQFVKFNDFRDEDGTNADLLAEAVLEEVPDQLVGFMTETGEKIGERNKSKN